MNFSVIKFSTLIKPNIVLGWRQCLTIATQKRCISNFTFRSGSGSEDAPQRTYGSSSHAARTFLGPNNSVSVVQKRFKKGKAPKKEEDSDDEKDKDSDDEAQSVEEDVVGRGYIDAVINVPSLRVDNVLKTGTPFGRTKVEAAFYEGRLRLNGEKLAKKSDLVAEGDEIDLILGRNVDNYEQLEVFRLVIQNVPDISSGKGRSNVQIRKFVKLLIPNYPDPYDGTLIHQPKGRE